MVEAHIVLEPSSHTADVFVAVSVPGTEKPTGDAAGKSRRRLIADDREAVVLDALYLQPVA
jgi:hypothetical protein